jgi:hypothetical protein
MRYHLHIGVDPVNLDRVSRELARLDRQPCIDGDGWNVWGEAVATDNNDDRTLHVIVRSNSVDTLTHLALALQAFCVPLPDGTVSVISEGSDWSEVLAVRP